MGRDRGEREHQPEPYPTPPPSPKPQTPNPKPHPVPSAPPNQARESRLIFIGKHLDQQELQRGFDSCLSTPENVAARLESLGLRDLRFGVGERVRCIVAGTWQAGVVVKLGYWAGRSMCPYQVELDDGSLVYAPHDTNAVIRPESDDARPAPQPTAVPPPAPPAPTGWAAYYTKQ